MTARRLRPLAASLLVVAMASLASGCSKGKQDSAENVAEPTQQQVEVDIPPAAPEPVVPVAPPPVVNEVEITPEEQLSEAEQIQEDADATGMTSRLPSSEYQPAENAPAQ